MTETTDRATFFAWDDWSGAYRVTVRDGRWLVDGETLERMIANVLDDRDPFSARQIVGDEAAEEVAQALRELREIRPADGLHDVTDLLGEPMECDEDGYTF